MAQGLWRARVSLPFGIIKCRTGEGNERIGLPVNKASRLPTERREAVVHLIVQGGKLQLAAAMSSFLKCLMAVSISLLVTATASTSAPLPGFVEGHLKIVSPKPVQPTDENIAAETAENYGDYPLVILSRDGQKEIARVTPDRNGNYRVALPPGDYILDVQGRARRHVRAKPQTFTIVSNQTVRIDMYIDTDHSRSS